MKYAISITLIFCIAIAFADTILLKNGVEIEGEIVAIGVDSVTIKTSAGVLNIAAVDIEKIETAEVKRAEPEKFVVREQGIPKSIKMVGFGCLGGVVGGTSAFIVGTVTDGFGGSPDVTAIVAGGLVILGIVIGAAMGGK